MGKRAQRLALPSGLVVSLRPVMLRDLASAGGTMPLPLLGLVVTTPATSAGSGGDLGKLLRLVALGAVTSPPLAAGAGDNDHLGLDELTQADLLTIYNEASGLNKWQTFVETEATILATLDGLARAYSTRPSAMLGERSPWVALQLDMVSAYLASQEHRPNDGPGTSAFSSPTGEGGFKTMADRATRKVVIKPDGTWD